MDVFEKSDSTRRFAEHDGTREFRMALFGS